MTIQREEEPTLADPLAPRGSRGEGASGGVNAPPLPHEPGTLLAGRYRLEGRIGGGGMGEVHRAFDTVLGERIAVKLLSPSPARDPGSARRVRDEVTLARKVSHPNVCRVHDVGEAFGALFVTMELIEGEDLAALLRRIGRLPSEKALEVARQVTAGVAAAHAAGVLHRDLKPANVMFDSQGRARLTDFGLAVAGAPREGDVSGTPLYMAPEVLAGGSSSERSDLYSLGLVLYELFTGRKPVDAATLAELRERRASTQPAPLSHVVPGLEARVERTILSCLAVDPAARPGSALEVLTGLSGGDAVGAALAAGQTPSPSAVAASGPEGALRPAVAWGLVAAIALVIAGGAALYTLVPATKMTAADLDGIPHPPAVLAVKAREALASLGLPEPGGRQEARFLYGAAALRWAGRDTGDGRWRLLFSTSRPAPIVFVFRRGIPATATENPWVVPAGSEVGPPLPAGAVSVTLDTRGRLLRLVAGPDPVAAPATLPAEEVAAEVFRLASLDPRQMSPADPSEVPPVFADERRAWHGRLPGRDDLAPRVEMATFRGRPVFVSVSFVPEEKEPRQGAPTRLTISQLSLLVELGTFLAALALALSNVRSGRGDTSGALRVAALVFTLDFAVKLLRWTMPASAAELGNQVAWRGGAALFDALVLGVFYLAIEPHARRLWPELLVAWARLLSGRARDPLVGRDLLLGISSYFAFFVATVVLLGAGVVLGGRPGMPVLPSLATLPETRLFLSALVDAPRNGVLLALVFLVVLVVCRLGAAPRLASLLFFLFTLAFGTLSLLTLSGRPNVFHVLLALAFAAGWTFLATRVGFLALAVVMSVLDLVVSVPVSLDLHVWWSDRGLWIAAILLLLAAWGARLASAGRRAAPA